MLWTCICHGPVYVMDLYMSWNCTCSGPVYVMDLYMSWTFICHGPVHVMDLHSILISIGQENCLALFFVFFQDVFVNC